MKIEKSHPNSKQLNLKLINDYYKIQEWLIQLGDDFAIEKLRALIDGKSLHEKVTFKSYSEKLISKMMEINKTGNAPPTSFSGQLQLYDFFWDSFNSSLNNVIVPASSGNGTTTNCT